MVSPGLSSVAANRPPIITVLAPAAIAFVISPENFIPPSAIIGILYLSATLAQSYIAVICGTPIPAITLVVQIEPGPMPTFIASLASISSFVASLAHFLQLTVSLDI